MDVRRDADDGEDADRDAGGHLELPLRAMVGGVCGARRSATPRRTLRNHHGVNTDLHHSMTISRSHCRRRCSPFLVNILWRKIRKSRVKTHGRVSRFRSPIVEVMGSIEPLRAKHKHINAQLY